MKQWIVSGTYSMTVEADTEEEAVEYGCDKIGNGWHWEAVEVGEVSRADIAPATQIHTAVIRNGSSRNLVTLAALTEGALIATLRDNYDDEGDYAGVPDVELVGRIESDQGLTITVDAHYMA